jgi:hypothetical protein
MWITKKIRVCGKFMDNFGDDLPVGRVMKRDEYHLLIDQLELATEVHN